MSDPHFGYVVAAYTVGFLLIGGMILSVIYDYLSLKRALSKFTQHSDTPASD